VIATLARSDWYASHRVRRAGARDAALAIEPRARDGSSFLEQTIDLRHVI
jgi:hypothetical protein